MTRLALAGLLSLLAAVLLAKEPIGLRANNPGNIHGVNWKAWQGGAGTDRFEYLRFRSPYYGLRAISVVLYAYGKRHGIRSVAGVCNRWVRKPHGRYQMLSFRSYLLAVSKHSGYLPNQWVNLENSQVEERLAHGIVWAEEGQDPYPEALYRTVFR